MSEILYLKIDRNIEVDHSDVTLGDVAKMECTNQSMVNHLKTLKLIKIHAEKSDRYIFSILKVVELIHTIYPNLEIQNMGEPDFIIEYESPSYAKDRWGILKAAFVCLTIFFGSAFSIMSFNNDISINLLFHEYYALVMGTESDGFTWLEFTYSLGIAVGVLIFYNHFGGKRITKDPTPIEVQMRTYEDDVNTTLIEGGNRKETNIDVD